MHNFHESAENLQSGHPDVLNAEKITLQFEIMFVGDKFSGIALFNAESVFSTRARVDTRVK